MAVGDVERRDAAAKSAAAVIGVSGVVVLVGSHGDIQPVVVQSRSSQDARRGMRVDLRLPQQRSFLRIERVHGAGVVAEKCGARGFDDVQMRERAFQFSRYGGALRLAKLADRNRRAAAGGRGMSPE